MKNTTWRYFEDLVVGERRCSDPYTVDKHEMLDYAQKYDPQPHHASDETARDTHFGEVIAPGTYTLALWRKLDHSINSDVAFVCGFGWDEVRWPVPVRAGDRLRAWSEITQLRASSKPEHGHATYQYGLCNQDNDVVLSFVSHNLVYSRSSL